MNKPFQPAGLRNINLTAILNAADRMSLVSLLIANMLPILFAVVFGWDVSSVVIFYWIENLVIGFWSIWRIIMANSSAMPIALRGGKFFMVPFFVLHYYGFCLGHGIFIGVIFSGFLNAEQSGYGSLGVGNLFRIFGELFGDFGTVASWSFVVAIAGIFFSHGISYFRNYIGNGQFRRSLPMQEMFRPYGRIVLLHVCILIGGILVGLLGAPIFLVLLLMLGKTLIDAAAHVASHHKESSGSIWERPHAKKDS